MPFRKVLNRLVRQYHFVIDEIGGIVQMMRQANIKTLVAGIMVILLVLPAVAAAAEPSLYAAASSLQLVMEEITKAYEVKNGNSPTGVFAASGTLARQMEMGAPYEFFLSANEEWARYLEEKDKLVRVRPLAECPLVLWWTREDAPSVDLLQSSKIRLAIADPAVAPFGVSAKKYLERNGTYRKLLEAKRLVLSGNVLQAALSVKSGGVDVALIPLSIALKLEGSWHRISAEPVKLFYGLKNGDIAEDAIAFLGFVKSPESRQIFRKNGFEPLFP
jgi:molybdate transport system substrate-binding protein